MRGHQQEMWYKIWMLRQLRQLRMCLGWVFLIRGDAGCIVSAYRLDFIVSDGLYRIVWIISYYLDRIRRHWILCADWFATGWMVRMDWMERWWDGCGTNRRYQALEQECPPLAPEQEIHHWLLMGGRMWEAVYDTNCVGATRARSICVRAEK